MKKQRPDKITAPEFFGDENAESIFHSVSAVDYVAQQMEDKWGCNRLPKLVSAETAAKFGSAKAKLDQAISENDAEAVTKRASVMQRGWEALDKEATAKGERPVSAVAWTWRDDDARAHAFVKDTAEAIAYGNDNPGVAVWTMAEVVRVVAAFDDRYKNLGNAAKIAFPGAEIVKIKNRKNFSDEIPF